MSTHNSYESDYKIIAALLYDAQNKHRDVFSIPSLGLTLKKVRSRLASEGLSFLTKTLPALGKAFDKALSNETCLNAARLRFSSMPDSKLPKFLGELFSQVFDNGGLVLQNPCIACISTIRLILFVFYKYELEFSTSDEAVVIDRFIKTEIDLDSIEPRLDAVRSELEQRSQVCKMSNCNCANESLACLTRRARIHLNRAFERFDPLDIFPKHGPGAVATGQQLWNKFYWKNISKKITDFYPLDEYFFSSAGSVCDSYKSFDSIGSETLPARVILVPKDSRGPRLISCEPVDFQWIQQGLGRAIVDHVERTKYTMYNIHFTDQGPNQCGALLGSVTGSYSTLDLKDASDRVSCSLVRLLFPPHIYDALNSCRTEVTELPDGRMIKLRKFAPMGSCLCFPVMALTIWAILTAGAPDKDTRDSILVYGDDIVVPTAYAERATSILESFGLLVNRDKSCTKGSFRESCGVDAYKGIDVTPIRLRTVWEASQSPEVYTSWISYANSFYDRQCYFTYDEIVGRLCDIYHTIPADDMMLSCPSLRYVPESHRPMHKRVNIDLQKVEWHVRDVKSRSIIFEIDGWGMLLRYFSEGCIPKHQSQWVTKRVPSYDGKTPFSVRSYTRRRTIKFVRRWR